MCGWTLRNPADTSTYNDSTRERDTYTKPIASEWKWFSTEAGSFFPAGNLQEFPQKFVIFVISQKRA